MATRKSSFFRLRLLSLIASHVQNSSTKQFMMERVFLPTGAVFTYRRRAHRRPCVSWCRRTHRCCKASRRRAHGWDLGCWTHRWPLCDLSQLNSFVNEAVSIGSCRSSCSSDIKRKGGNWCLPICATYGNIPYI